MITDADTLSDLRLKSGQQTTLKKKWVRWRFPRHRSGAREDSPHRFSNQR
jgi:hypothetical protein